MRKRYFACLLVFMLPLFANAQQGATCGTAIAADVSGFSFPSQVSTGTWFRFSAKERKCRLAIPKGTSFLLFESEGDNFCNIVKQPSAAVNVIAKRGSLGRTAGIELPSFTQEELNGRCACDVCSGDEYKGDLMLKKDASYYLLLLGNTKDIKLEFINVPVSDIEGVTEKKEPVKDTKTEKQLSSLKVGEKVTLKNILFYSGTPDLYPGAQSDLDALLKFMQDNKTVKIEIQGHVHGTPGLDDNVPLSVARAQVVYDFLVKNGIEEGRLTYKGYGVSKIIYTGPDPALQQQNRRVEVLILAK